MSKVNTQALSDLAEVNPRVDLRGLHGESFVSFIPMSDVTEAGRWTGDQVRKLNEVRVGYTPFADGDILFAKITPCMENGKGAHATGLANGVGFGSTEFHVLRARGDNDPRFLFHWLQARPTRGRAVAFMGGSAGQQRVQADFFSRFRIPSIEPGEQTRIAAVLDTVDEVIGTTEVVIAKLRQVRAGLLHDLLTRGLDENGEVRDPIAHPELFKDSPMGRIPRAWDAAELGDLVPNARPIVYGILMPGKGFPGGIPVVKVKDIRGGNIDTTELLLTDPRIDEVYRRSRVQTGDLLFTIRGTVGRIALVPESLNGANITQDTARVSLNRANPRFVARWLEMPVATKFIETHTVGVAVRGINLGDVRKIPIAVPPRDEQDRIADVLDTSDQQLLAEQSSLVKLIHLKSGLAADLLTGRVRVPGVIPRDDVGEHLQATLALEAAGVIG